MIQPTLLLVDSYHSSRRALADLLRECGYSVIEVHNALEGLQLARERLPELVLVDPWPFVSASLQMIERLRASTPTEHIPVLVLTSSLSPQYRERARAAGCAGYLEKPCPPEAVLTEVSCLLSPLASYESARSAEISSAC